jgi:SAM-dependent methyltransferase
MPSDESIHQPMQAAWEEAAGNWIRWARSPRHDHAFWRLNLPGLLRMLPPPCETVDVGCGEGRFGRELLQRGYRVTGVETSETLARAARDADPPLELCVADAAAMPLPDDRFDLAVASLSLMNMDRLPAVVDEIARVLRPGGRFGISLLHPLASLREGGPDASYFDEIRYAETVERGGLRMTFHDTHRPLSAYLGALERAGFVIEALREPVPDDAYVADHPEVARWRRRPPFLHVRARLDERRAGAAT